MQEAARTLTSKPAKRAVVNAGILFFGAWMLLFFAAIGSVLFFQNFVPHQALSKPVYLQYGYGHPARPPVAASTSTDSFVFRSGIHPYAVVSLREPALKSVQDYDISVTLSMPPSPSNMEQGNFMVTLHLLQQDASSRLLLGTAGASKLLDGQGILFTTRRPTLVPYMDPITSVASRVLLLFYHMLFPSSRICKITVPLAERLSFPTDAVVPASAYLEIEAGQSLQTYQVSLNLTAKLRGLRWLMHHYRLPMYILFTFKFWVLEMLFMGVAWSFLSSFTAPPAEEEDDGATDGGRKVGKARLLTKAEEDEEDEHSDESDHPHSFPTYGKQPPLKHEPEVKDEEHEKPLSEIPIGGAEADDERDDDDDGGRQLDSGTGMSYSGEGIGQVRRRTSHHGD